MPPETDITDVPLLLPGQRFGQFVIISQIGSGGMGQVYKARHTTLEEDFAVKILHPEITKDPASIFRLRMEARTAFHLKHPNVLGIDEFNEADGKFYLRMPLMTGLPMGNDTAVSLRQVMTLNGGRLPEGDAAIILYDILSGLAFAHEHGVIHRDIKPANILFNGKTALISDFGLVRIVGEEFFRSKIDQTVAVSKLGMPSASASSGSSSLIGTYNYMAPEQKLGTEADERSDVYAAGLIALDMLTGRTSFGMKAPSRSVKGLSSEWDSFLEKALEPDAADRFKNGQEMFANMPAIRTKPTVVTGRTLVLKEQKKEPGKRKTIVIAAIVLAALALAGAGAAAVLFFSGNSSNDTIAQDTPLLQPLPNTEPAGAGAQPVRPATTSPDQAPAASVQSVAQQPVTNTAPQPGPVAAQPVENAPAQSSPSQAPQMHAMPVAETPPVANAPMEPVTANTAAVAQQSGPQQSSAAQQPAQSQTAPVAEAPAQTPAPAEAAPAVDRTWQQITLPGGVAMRMRRIEAGKFMFGSRNDEVGRAANRESAQREVTISKPFYICQYELTQGQYEAIAGRNPSRFRSFDNPVEQVSFNSIVKTDGFLDILNRYLAQNGFDNLHARLPSEEEWEYACRAGSEASFNDGSNLPDSSGSGNTATFAVCGKPYGMSTKVGSLVPNKWGLYDMHGNIDEMTDKGVLRGGSWASPARDCRSAARRNMGIAFRGDEKTGLRLVFDDKNDATPAPAQASTPAQ
jgi:serine/threonine protein kinase